MKTVEEIRDRIAATALNIALFRAIEDEPHLEGAEYALMQMLKWIDGEDV